MENIERNYQYFKKEEKKLKQKYLDEFIIIYDEKVAFHDKVLNKVIEYARQLEAGKYIIQRCEKNSVQMFHTRVAF